VKRDGELRTMHVSDMKAKTVQHIVREHVAPGSNIMTDEHGALTGLEGDYRHHTVNHSGGEYVRHYVLHTNSIESVWALLKRQMYGIHPWVSPKHLSRYADENDVALQPTRSGCDGADERVVRVRGGPADIQGADRMTGKRKLEPPLRLDMDFGEALERFARADPKDVGESVERSKQRKPPENRSPGGLVSKQKRDPPKDRRRKPSGGT
jgi:hypothetical protein